MLNRQRTSSLRKQFFIIILFKLVKITTRTEKLDIQRQSRFGIANFKYTYIRLKTVPTQHEFLTLHKYLLHSPNQKLNIKCKLIQTHISKCVSILFSLLPHLPPRPEKKYREAKTLREKNSEKKKSFVDQSYIKNWFLIWIIVTHKPLFFCNYAHFW